jgi:uncharacterized membrane protein YeaQ/YmgE (transglycosylase-associated protein family)
VSNIIWIVVIGFLAGIVARILSPGPNNPSGFILTIVLGVAGAFLATFIGQTIGWYRLDQGCGFHRGHGRRTRRLVHLEPAGGAERDFRPRHSRRAAPLALMHRPQTCR